MRRSNPASLLRKKLDCFASLARTVSGMFALLLLLLLLLLVSRPPSAASPARSRRAARRDRRCDWRESAPVPRRDRRYARRSTRDAPRRRAERIGRSTKFDLSTASCLNLSPTAGARHRRVDRGPGRIPKACRDIAIGTKQIGRAVLGLITGADKARGVGNTILVAEPPPRRRRAARPPRHRDCSSVKRFPPLKKHLRQDGCAPRRLPPARLA